MRTLNIAEDLSCAADGSSAAVDLAGKKHPFLPNNSAVVALSLQGAGDTVIKVQGSDDSTFATGVEDYATEDLTAAAATTKTVYKEITMTKRYIRVNNNEVTTGLGAVSADLLSN